MSQDKGDSHAFATEANVTDWLWSAEMEEPISLDLPETEQVQRLLRARVVEANESFARGFERPLSDLLGKCRIGDCFPPWRQSSADLLCALVQSGYRLENYETCEPTENGDSRIFVNTFIGTIQQGRVSRVWGSSRDVTQSRRQQKQIQLQQEAIDSTNDSLLIADATQPDYPLVYVNDRFLHMTGYDGDQVLGRNCRFLQGPDTDQATAAKIRKALSSGTRFQGEILNYRKDGTPFWNFLRISPVRDRYFRITHFVGLSTDITKEKAVQLANKKQHNELAHLSRAESIVEIGAALAHELNQPLAAILRNAQAAVRFLDSESPDLAEIREILTDVIKDDRRAGQVLTRIRQHLSKDASERAKVNVNEVVEDAMALLHSDLIMKRTMIDAQLAPRLPAILGDAIQLQQVIVNLILNAEDAMHDVAADKSLVTIKTIASEGAIELSVSDNGHGIAEDKLDHIFEPFYTSKEGGMGVGLAICKRIIESHDGRISAETLEAGGARVSFSLPILTDEHEHDFD